MQRVALITGGSRGIGAGIASALAKDKFSVIITGRRPAGEVLPFLSSLHSLTSDAMYVQADITNAAARAQLLQSVKEREFRSDLFYRLNVFPILIPPLRERREDIKPLIEHFVHKFSTQMKKSITSIPTKTMELLVRWEWPGNIRELENFMERSVILTPGSVLQAPLSELQTVAEQSDGSGSTLRDKERERILRALRDCHGRLGGPEGAAARLGLKRTTLQSKLDHLGIKPAAYRA